MNEEADKIHEKLDAAGNLIGIIWRIKATGKTVCRGNYTHAEVEEISSRYNPANSFGKSPSKNC